MNRAGEKVEGGCSCGTVRYRCLRRPIIVHCCHCSYCQRQNGSAFAVNALYFAEDVELIEGEVNEVTLPSPSGNGQKFARCPRCEVAVWSNYYMGGVKEGVRFVRVGSLDEPSRHPPDVHIYTVTKQPWVALPFDRLVVEEFYDMATEWSPGDMARFRELMSRADEAPFEHQVGPARQ